MLPPGFVQREARASRYAFKTNFMMPFHSARLTFRPLEAADAAGMFALDSDPTVHRYLGGIGGPMVTEPAQSAGVIAATRQQYADTGLGRWAVLHRETGDFMGWAGLKLVRTEVNGRRGFYDLGYRFRPAYWGQGYGGEAAQAWLRYGFETLALPTICGYADAENQASCRILTRIGLQPTNEFDEGGTRCIWFEASRTAWLG